MRTISEAIPAIELPVPHKPAALQPLASLLLPSHHHVDNDQSKKATDDVHPDHHLVLCVLKQVIANGVLEALKLEQKTKRSQCRHDFEC